MKRIIALVLMLALALCAALALVSCGEPEPTPTACTSHKDNNNDGICDTEGCGKPVTSTPSENTVKYEITVTNEAGEAVPGVVIVVETADAVSDEATTNAEGKAEASLEIESEGYVRAYAVVKSVPTGYELPESSTLIADGKASITLEVAVEPTEFTVKLVDADGNAVALAGAEIQICQSTCLKAGYTDASGELTASFVPENAKFKLEIVNIDALGYEYVDELVGGYIVFDADETEFNIKIAPKA